MVEKIDGIAMAEKIKIEIAKKIHQDQKPGPNLAIILVGDRSDSKLYVSLKEREGKKIGIDTHLYKMDADISEQKLIEVVDFLNHDPLIDGILIQLPLPVHLNTDKIISAIDPLKDVDGFHPLCPDYLHSPVLAAVAACLDDIKFLASGKRASLLYNSEIFGGSLRSLLDQRGMIFTNKSTEADLLISALGEAEKIKGPDIKEGAVLIDIGTSTKDGKLFGDLDWDSIAKKASFATPVPGGIGPLTIAFLFKNLYEAYKRKNNE